MRARLSGTFAQSSDVERYLISNSEVEAPGTQGGDVGASTPTRTSAHCPFRNMSMEDDRIARQLDQLVALALLIHPICSPILRDGNSR